MHIINHDRIRKALENRTNMEDDRVAILEAQLSQAKLIAEEADKKYEEVEKFKLSCNLRYVRDNVRGLTSHVKQVRVHILNF